MEQFVVSFTLHLSSEQAANEYQQGKSGTDRYIFRN
jgi:hypothetical protein